MNLDNVGNYVIDEILCPNYPSKKCKIVCLYDKVLSKQVLKILNKTIEVFFTYSHGNEIMFSRIGEIQFNLIDNNFMAHLFLTKNHIMQCIEYGLHIKINTYYCQLPDFPIITKGKLHFTLHHSQDIEAIKYFTRIEELYLCNISADINKLKKQHSLLKKIYVHTENKCELHRFELC